MTRWANLRDTAAYFGVTERLLRSMVYDGRLVKTKLGGKLIFDLDAIEQSIRDEAARPRHLRRAS